MSDTFVAQSLVATNTGRDGRSFELTFVDTHGHRHTLRLPQRIAAELAPVFSSLLERLGGPAPGAHFTKLPKACAVGRASHAPLVLIRFDDEPPYGLRLEETKQLYHALREEAKAVFCEQLPLRKH
jgi:hypothetical protein